MNNKNMLLCSILVVVLSMMLFGCTEGKAVTIPSSNCHASDGADLYVKGNIQSSDIGYLIYDTVNLTNGNDSCVKDLNAMDIIKSSLGINNILEFSCEPFLTSDKLGDAYGSVEPCPNGCLNGACITATPPTATTGSFNITSTPSGASIFLKYADGTMNYVGTTPLIMKDLTPGYRQFKFQYFGDYMNTSIIGATIIAGQTVNVAVNLTKYGSMSVYSSNNGKNFDGANVTINNVYKKLTPYLNSQLAPGTYTVKVTKAGYKDYSSSQTVVSEKQTVVNAIMTTVPSCTGNIPGNAILCDKDNEGLTANTAITIIGFCGTKKCEYTCKPGFARASPTAKTCTAKK